MQPGMETAVSHVDLDRLIAELDAGMGRLPEEALRQAQQHRELVIPKLIEVLQSATEQARQGNVPEGNAHFFALFLLAEFQAKEALPALVEAVSLPGDLPDELFGGAITDGLNQALAVLAADRLDVLDALIGNGELYEFVRWAAVSAYVYHVAEGTLSRDEAVSRLRDHLREAIRREDYEITGPLICELISVGPKDAYEEIAEAYRQDLVDGLLVGLEDVDDAVSRGDARISEELARHRERRFHDTVEYLSGWYCFSEEYRAARTRAEESSYATPNRGPDLMPDRAAADIMPESVPESTPAASPITSRGDRVSRNDPCPCGSGKKYKKCCGSSAQSVPK